MVTLDTDRKDCCSCNDISPIILFCPLHIQATGLPEHALLVSSNNRWPGLRKATVSGTFSRVCFLVATKCFWSHNSGISAAEMLTSYDWLLFFVAWWADHVIETSSATLSVRYTSSSQANWMNWFWYWHQVARHRMSVRSRTLWVICWVNICESLW
jgi:hypothetical protein